MCGEFSPDLASSTVVFDLLYGGLGREDLNLRPQCYTPLFRAIRSALIIQIALSPNHFSRPLGYSSSAISDACLKRASHWFYARMRMSIQVKILRPFLLSKGEMATEQVLLEQLEFHRAVVELVKNRLVKARSV